MSVMRALDEVEYVYTRDGKKRVTHEAYSYMITPFAYPPIKVLIYKGHIDRQGIFQALASPKDIILTQDEFKELLCPNAHGKPAGDFRLSDILRCLRRRDAPAAEAEAGKPGTEAGKPGTEAGKPGAEAAAAAAPEAVKEVVKEAATEALAVAGTALAAPAQAQTPDAVPPG
jgi:hypothetical protein